MGPARLSRSAEGPVAGALGEIRVIAGAFEARWPARRAAVAERATAPSRLPGGRAGLGEQATDGWPGQAGQRHGRRCWSANRAPESHSA